MTTSHSTSTDPDHRLSSAERLHELHQETLVLPNAWDVASARVAERAGAAAIATTSAGVSWAAGVPDGEQLAWDRALDLARRLVSAVDVPVTVDVEGGYDDLEATVSDVIEAGVAGINLEDSQAGSLRATEDQARRVARARAVADEAGVPLFVNARTDVYLLGVPNPVDEALRRASAYVAAGADGIFVPGAADAADIRSLARGIPVPLNVMAGPGALPVDELRDLGVRRVSVGMAIAQTAYAVVHRAATELLVHGTYEHLGDGLDYGELNVLMSPP